MDDESNTKPTANADGHTPVGQSDDANKHAADIARTQIAHIYQNNPPHQSNDSTQSPYNRTHTDNFDWREYHSAWQTYYQEYYRRYYQHLHTKKEAPDAPQNHTVTGEDSERVAALKKDVVTQVQRAAKGIKRSHHFWPIVSAVTVGIVFLFVQFNSILFAQVQAYISPGALEGQSLVITDPANNATVGPEPRLIIPKINVDVPVNYDVTTLVENDIQLALRDAAVHYHLPGANALPGEYGNNVILGHSSNDVFAPGKYKFAFVLTDHLAPGDTMYLHYKGVRYTYKVTDKKVIKPNELGTLQVGYDKPMVTLVTCTPPGTALNRLLVFAEQISPDPAAATKPIEQTNPTSPPEQAIPGNAPTLFEQIWGFFF